MPRTRVLVSAVVAAALLVSPISALQTAPPLAGGLSEQAPSQPCAGVDVGSVARRWQETLRLQDWEIEAKCAMPEKFWKSNLGISASDTAARKAVVLVHPDIKDPRLVSEVVLHELLHVLLFDLKEAESVSVDEQVVRALTVAILGRDPKKRDKKLDEGLGR